MNYSATAMEAVAQPQPHVAMFAATGKGHLFPLIELARKLLRCQSFAVTVIIPDDGSSLEPQKDLLRTVPGTNLALLPPVSLDDIPPTAPIEIPIILSVTRSIPALRRVLADLQSSVHLTAFIADVFGVHAFPMVKELGIQIYLFQPSPAMMMSLVLHLPQLDQSCTCQFRDLPEPVKLPGCVPVNGSDLFDPIQDRQSEVYKSVLEMFGHFKEADGVLINSFPAMEEDTFKALEEACESGGFPPVYPIGPVIRSGSENCNSKEECLKWLDEQPDRSVLFVSFGSGGTLSSLQMKELAAGLEGSGQRFLLVARRPNDLVRTGAYFSGKGEMDPGVYFPASFMEKVKAGKGFVVTNWVPQVEVLRHAAVGGFLTHCGWNSALESVVHGGVPLIAWPLFAEQKMNAVLLSEGLRVAVRVREGEDGVVDGDQIAKLVRKVVEGAEGAELRRRARELKEAAGAAMGEDGSCNKAVADLARKVSGKK
ncbi:hydroquinone glucosyltransferase-like [Andrographis paniculata]|uniref:hydroquinone glucosyltransferase-like n=1 Tax=Andrographis paniculata TaxID=175694 RepID=UPI0021E92057|nr:hydroquinone glucosyltransferase-like [Andrographis paniculata]